MMIIAGNEPATPPPKKRRLHGACDACKKKKGMHFNLSDIISYTLSSQMYAQLQFDNDTVSRYIKATVQRCPTITAQTVLYPVFNVHMQSLVNQR